MFISHKIFFFLSHFYTDWEPRNVIQGCPGDHLFSISTHSIQFWGNKGAFRLVLTLKSQELILIQTDVLVFFSFGLFTSQLWFILMANVSHNRKTKSNKVTIMAFTKIKSFLPYLQWTEKHDSFWGGGGFPGPYQNVFCFLLILGKRHSVDQPSGSQCSHEFDQCLPQKLEHTLLWRTPCSGLTVLYVLKCFGANYIFYIIILLKLMIQVWHVFNLYLLTML